jgi:Carboxypeptidase regulatory-like domain
MDNSGAAIPGAKITITTTDRKAVERMVTTNKSGNYSAPQLPIGRYELVVEAPAFK